jgi:hypothetical protein
MHGVERVRYCRAGLAGMVDARGPFSDRSKGRELIRQFMQDATTTADERCRDIGGQAQHRRTGTQCGTQSRASVEDTRARDHREDSGLSAALRVTERHIAGGLLVSSRDESYAIAGAVERIEQIVGVRTRNAE